MYRSTHQKTASSNFEIDIKMSEIRLVTRAEPKWERVVFAEVLLPETLNVYGDFWTAESVKECAYAFMRAGFGIDVDHDNLDMSYAISVVETFIAREGDPDFVVGAWVVAMHIGDDQIWQGILDNKINGYSYEALVEFLQGVMVVEDDQTRTGTTMPDLTDGHTHEFFTIVDMENRPIVGGTSETNGHSHTISVHTVTDIVAGHTHRYSIGQKG